MKIFIGIMVGIVLILVFVTATGFYPVAFVGYTPIFYGTLKKTEEAGKSFANFELKRIGKKQINFSLPENAELLLQGRRDTLVSLIDDVIVAQEGKSVVNEFAKVSQERADTALGKGRNLQQAALLIYGLSLKDFEELVLLPQARRDVLGDGLKSKNQNFDKWLVDAKKNKAVHLFFVPFYWDGEQVK